MADDSQPSNNTQPNLPGIGETSNGPWALEDTLKKVLGVLQKDLANNARQNRNFDILNRNIDRLSQNISDSSSSDQNLQRKNINTAAETKKQLEDIKKASNRAAKAQEEAIRADKPSKNAARDNLLGGGGGGGGGVLGFVTNLAMKTGKGVMDAGKAIVDSGGDIAQATEGVARAIPGIGAILASSARMVNDTRNQFAQMAKTGQTFNGNMMEFANTAADAALSTSQAVQILGDNAEAAARIGGANFLRLQREVRSTTEQFGRFGLSVEDQAKVLGNFTEIQLMRGRRDQAQNAKAAADYTAKMVALAKATGQSIDSLMQNDKNLEKSADMFSASQAVYERFGKTAADNFERVYKDVSNKLVGTDAQKPVEALMANIGNWDSMVQSDLGQAFAQAGKLDDLVKLRDAMTSGNDGQVTKILQGISGELNNRDSDLAKRVGALSRTGNLDPALFAGMRDLTALSSDANKNTSALAAQMKTDNKGTGKATDLSTYDQNQTVVQEQLGKAYAAILNNAAQLQPALQQLTIAAAQMTAAFMASDVVKDTIGQFSGAVVDATQHMQDFISTLTVFDTLGSGLGWVIGKLMEFGGWLGKFTGIGEGWGKLLVAAGAWFGGKGLLGKAGSGIKSLFGFGEAGGAAAGAAEGAGAAAAKGLTGQLLKGAARGGILSAAFEGLGYLGPDGKALTMANVGRSAFKLAGGALGGAVGSLGGPLGTVAGGAVGYYGASKLSDYLFGPDEMKKAQARQPEKKEAPKPQPPAPRVRPAAPKPVPPINSQSDVDKRIAQIQSDYQKQNEEAMASIRRRVEAQASRPPAPIQPSQQARMVQPAALTRPVTPGVGLDPNHRDGKLSSTTTPIQHKRRNDEKVNFPVGDEMQNRQLQEMQNTNKWLAGIYANGKPPVRPKPSVVMYNGLWD